MTYLTHKTKSPIMLRLSRIKKVPHSRSPINKLEASVRDIGPKYQLKQI